MEFSEGMGSAEVCVLPSIFYGAIAWLLFEGKFDIVAKSLPKRAEVEKNICTKKMVLYPGACYSLQKNKTQFPDESTGNLSNGTKVTIKRYTRNFSICQVPPPHDRGPPNENGSKPFEVSTKKANMASRGGGVRFSH